MRVFSHSTAVCKASVHRTVLSQRPHAEGVVLAEPQRKVWV